MAQQCKPETTPKGSSTDSKLSWFRKVKLLVGRSRVQQLLHYVDITSCDNCPDCEKLHLLRELAKRSEDQTQRRGLSSATQHETIKQATASETEEVSSISRRLIQHHRPGERIQRRPVPPTQPNTSALVHSSREPSPIRFKPVSQLRDSRKRRPLYKEPEVEPLTEDQSAIIWQDVRELAKVESWKQLESIDTCVEENYSGVRTALSSPGADTEDQAAVCRSQKSLKYLAEHADTRQYPKLHLPTKRVISQIAIMDRISVVTDNFDPQLRDEDVSPLSSPASSPRSSSPVSLILPWDDTLTWLDCYNHYLSSR
ncbi:hypothetical protein ACMFMG_006832 [Clarireedia jacksonii]